MKYAVAFVIALAAIGCSSSPYTRVVKREGEPDVVLTKEGDTEVEAAKAEARRTLPDFIKQLSSPGKRDFLLKVKFDTPKGGAEHIWVADVTYANGRFTGVIDNEPYDLPNIKLGDKVTVPETDVSDWLIVDEAGHQSGGFTIAALKKREQAK